LRAGIELLERAGVPYALAGRIAVWSWVESSQQEFTKDVDFAVPEEGAALIARTIEDAGYELKLLPTGGVAIRSGDVRVDFIDRRHGLAVLFAEAVHAARDEHTTTRTEDGMEVPVVPPEYLIAMKMATGAPRDERDVLRLLAVPGLRYDLARSLVRRHAGLGSANRLDHLGVQVGLADARRYLPEPSP
jgi:hypothetical protein